MKGGRHRSAMSKRSAEHCSSLTALLAVSNRKLSWLIPVVLNREFYPQGTLCDIWRHFQLS